MNRLAKIESGTHYIVGETVDHLGLVRWVFECLVCDGETVFENISAVAALAGIQDHILDRHPEVVS